MDHLPHGDVLLIGLKQNFSIQRDAVHHQQISITIAVVLHADTWFTSICIGSKMSKTLKKLRHNQDFWIQMCDAAKALGLEADRQAALANLNRINSHIRYYHGLTQPAFSIRS
jgi:hypothetical protein